MYVHYIHWTIGYSDYSNKLGTYMHIYIYNSVRLFVLFAIRVKTTAQGATKLSGIMKYGSGSVLHELKSTV